MTNCEITGCHSSSSGGAICNRGNLIMTDCDISENEAAGRGGGVHVNDNGTLSMSGAAKITEDNDVYLTSLATITVSDGLTAPPPVATITLSEYREDLQILTAGEDREIDEEICSKFKITSNPNESEWKEWKITPSTDKKTGVLKKDGVSGGIEIVTPDFETYTFTVDVDGEPLIDAGGGEWGGGI